MRTDDASSNENYPDYSIPEGVEQIWLHLNYSLPSLTMLLATFTITDTDGDLSDLLRRNYPSERFETRIHVPGRLGGLRGRLPWSRPREYRVRSRLRSADDNKAHAANGVIGTYEQACLAWLSRYFPGRFSLEERDRRPVVRLLATENQAPFRGEPRWLLPAGLGRWLHIWRSPEYPDWAFDLSSSSLPHIAPRPYVATAAMARCNAIANRGEGGASPSNRQVALSFHELHSTLVVRWTQACLLESLTDRLGELRDRSATRRRLRRPVRQARELDGYLLGEGLDVATITQDILRLAEDVETFSWGFPEYHEDTSGHPPGVVGSDSTLGENLRQMLIVLAERLAADTGRTTRNVIASAQLRQAISNTRLQRTVLALSLIALVVAVIGLGVAL